MKIVIYQCDQEFFLLIKYLKFLLFRFVRDTNCRFVEGSLFRNTSHVNQSPPRTIEPEILERVLEMIENHPELSVKRIALNLGIMYQLLCDPYHFRPEERIPDDLELRLNRCQVILNRVENPHAVSVNNSQFRFSVNRLSSCR